jgi:uncharacterized membrane protein YbhN (UPF0104 family)
MSAPETKRTYKVISLLIKTSILIFSFLYILHKINSTPDHYAVFNLIQGSEKKALLLTFLLMFINWGLEAIKWQFLIKPLEKISFFNSLRSVFSGVTVSIFMPNRIGEFAGRIFFLESADKINATLKNFVGGLIQLCITVSIGVIACFVFVRLGYDNHLTVNFFNLRFVRIILFLVIVLMTILFVLNKFRTLFSAEMQSHFRAVFDLETKDVFIIFTVSLLRYGVFLFQYFLVLRAFHIIIDLPTASVLIAIIFLITSVVPTFALTEIATRGATAVYIFSCISNDTNAIVTASLVVWLINLALPALIGSAFIWQLKFFKQ